MVMHTVVRMFSVCKRSQLWKKLIRLYILRSSNLHSVPNLNSRYQKQNSWRNPQKKPMILKTVNKYKLWKRVKEQREGEAMKEVGEKWKMQCRLQMTPRRRQKTISPGMTQKWVSRIMGKMKEIKVCISSILQCENWDEIIFSSQGILKKEVRKQSRKFRWVREKRQDFFCDSEITIFSIKN